MASTWRIGEIAELTGLTRRALRHYDDLGLLVPSSRGVGDYRLYDERDLIRLLQIQNLKALGLSLTEIAAALSDPTIDARATLRSHLKHLAAQIAAEQRLLARLEHLLAGSLDWRDVLATIELTQRLSHPDPNIRLRAALGETAGSAEELLAALLVETDPVVSDALIWALVARDCDPAAVITLLADAETSALPWLVRLLGKLRAPSAVPALLGQIAGAGTDLAGEIVAALGRIQTADALTGLVGLLGNEEIPQTALEEAIAGFGDLGVEPVAARLTEADPHLRRRAAEVLVRIGSPAGCAPLATALRDPDRAVRLAALLGLGELGEPGRARIRQYLGSDPELDSIARRLLGPVAD